jgi:hypothetical protein
MTKITNNNNLKDMQIHIQKAYDLIDKYLPANYAKGVLKKLPEDSGISKGMIRNVKKKTSTRLDILNAMVEVALEYKELEEKLKEKLI